MGYIRRVFRRIVSAIGRPTRRECHRVIDPGQITQTLNSDNERIETKLLRDLCNSTVESKSADVICPLFPYGARWHIPETFSGCFR